MLHSPDNHLTEKHLQRFYDYHSPKRRLKSKKRKSPSEEGHFKFYLFICFFTISDDDTTVIGGHSLSGEIIDDRRRR